MKHLEEPIRHLDPDSQAPADLCDMLRAARQDGPNVEQMTRMLSHIKPIAAPPSNSILSSSGIALSSIAKILILLSFAAVAAVVYKTWSDSDSNSSTKSTDSLPPALEQEITNPTLSSKPVSQANSATESNRSPISRPNRANRLKKSKSPNRTAMSRVGHPPQPDANRELDLLREARKALPYAASRALTLTEEHRRDYPHGVFEQEREAIAIESLLRIGYKARAENRAVRFYQHFPASAYRHRIERLFNRESNFEKTSDQPSPIK